MNAEFVLTPYEDVVDPKFDEDGEQVQFTFDELDDSAKNTARDKWREDDLDNGWWEFVYEDAVAVGKLIGIEIGSRRAHGSGPITPGKERTCPDISFSDFYSQGDGCCYSGDLYIEELKDCVARLREHTGQGCTDSSLFALAAEGEALYELILLRLVTLRMTGEVDEDAIQLDSRVAIEGNDHCYRTGITCDYGLDVDIRDAMDSYVSSFADWIYKQLEAEHDYLTDDETVDEAIKYNDCIFDAYGAII